MSSSWLPQWPEGAILSSFSWSEHRQAGHALEQILRYPWPGNIRELENAIERACALATGDTLELAGLPDEVRNHQSLIIASEHVRPLREIEREYILAALDRKQGNRTLTAQQLDIAPATLFRKLKGYANGQLTLLLATEVARRCMELAGAV